MKQLKSFLFADVPLSILHFVLFYFIRGFLGRPGTDLASACGAASEGVFWWCLMVLNSLVWGAVLSLIVLPILRKVLK